MQGKKKEEKRREKMGKEEGETREREYEGGY